jgi:hypothetical protein
VRKMIVFAGLSSLLLCSVSGAFAAPPAKSGSGNIVIVFKDGHRQTYNLADIVRVEFPGGASVAEDTSAESHAAPPRGRFLGKWEVGDGSGNNFIITLNENGDAHRSLRSANGKWEYVNGEARITWDDGPQDAIRRVGTRFQKFAYAAGKSFTDTPDNVTDAHNTTPRPI